MINQLPYLLLAAVVCWINFVTIDILAGLPRKGGVSGAESIAKSIENSGGSLHGGYMMGNIVCSPDASAGTLLAACGVYAAGIPGGIAAAILVFIGNRICHDSGLAGTTGTITATIIIYAFTLAGIGAEYFIIGMIIAILTIQGISHVHASRLVGILWRWRTGE